jgi:hypothetical protein
MPVKLDNWNNAALLAYGNYYSDYSLFEKMLGQCGGSVKRFVAWIASEHEKDKSSFRKAPEEQMRRISGAGACPI